VGALPTFQDAKAERGLMRAFAHIEKKNPGAFGGCRGLRFGYVSIHTSSAATRNPEIFESDFDRLCAAADTRKARGEPPRYIEPSRWLKLSDAIPHNWEGMLIGALVAHFDRARRRDGAPPTTIEALMLALRRGGSALSEGSNLRRLGELSEAQLHEVSGRLQKFKPHIARAWTPTEVEALVDTWGELKHGR